MGLNTKIYSNHSLKIPKNAKEVIKLLMDNWNGKAEIVNSIEIKESDLKSDLLEYKILICPKLIEFEYPKFNQITLNSNFIFSGYIKIYAKSICFTPIGIGRNATNMIANFMDESIDFYHDEESLNIASQNWISFKAFMYNFTDEIGGNNFIYINDGFFSGIEEIAWKGGTIDKMIEKSNKNCETV